MCYYVSAWSIFQYARNITLCDVIKIWWHVTKMSATWHLTCHFTTRKHKMPATCLANKSDISRMCRQRQDMSLKFRHCWHDTTPTFLTEEARFDHCNKAIKLIRGCERADTDWCMIRRKMWRSMFLAMWQQCTLCKWCRNCTWFYLVSFLVTGTHNIIAVVCCPSWI
jgi:hypothetical protein